MAKIEELHPTQDEIDYWKEQVRPIFELRLGTENTDKVDKAIEDVIEKAKSGWPKAPKSFATRVRNAAKDWGVDGENKKHLVQNKNKGYKVSKKYKDTVLARRERELEAFLELYDGFTEKLEEKDKKYFRNRVKYYMREYRFNMSSDLPLLLELIAEELLHRRIMVDVAAENDLSDVNKLSKTLKLVTESMREIQKVLGITRQQRQKALGGTEGSVAEVSMLLEEKKKKIEAIEKEEKEQERILMQAKLNRDDINSIPDDQNELKRILSRTEDIEVSR